MKPLLVNRSGFIAADGNDYPTQVSVTSGSENTKGSWTTVIPSTGIDATELLLSIDGFGSSGQQHTSLLDIAIGPSAGPSLLVENLQISYLFDSTRNYPFYRIPLRIPAGSEIILRHQSAVSGLSIGFAAGVAGPDARGLLAFNSVTNYGAVTASSKGTAITLPGSTNTKGSWVEVASATAIDHWLLGIGYGADWGPGLTNANYLIDIGVGAVGNEIPIIENLGFQTSSAEILFNVFPQSMPIPWSPFIPAGTRLVARSAASSLFTPPNITLHGFGEPHGFHYRHLLASSKSLVGRLEG